MLPSRRCSKASRLRRHRLRGRRSNLCHNCDSRRHAKSRRNTSHRGLHRAILRRHLLRRPRKRCRRRGRLCHGRVSRIRCRAGPILRGPNCHVPVRRGWSRRASCRPTQGRCADHSRSKSSVPKAPAGKSGLHRRAVVSLSTSRSAALRALLPSHPGGRSLVRGRLTVMRVSVPAIRLAPHLTTCLRHGLLADPDIGTTRRNRRPLGQCRGHRSRRRARAGRHHSRPQLVRRRRPARSMRPQEGPGRVRRWVDRNIHPVRLRTTTLTIGVAVKATNWMILCRRRSCRAGVILANM